MNRELPKLDEMTDGEAVRWYTATIARLSKEKLLDSKYAIALLDWKMKMNKRLKENRDQEKIKKQQA